MPAALPRPRRSSAPSGGVRGLSLNRAHPLARNVAGLWLGRGYGKNDASGSPTLFDYSPYRNDCAASGATNVSLVTTDRGWAAQGDGTFSGAYPNAPSAAQYDAPSGAVSCWVRLNALTGGTSTNLLTRIGGLGTNGLALAAVGTSNLFKFYANDGAATTTVTGTTVLALNQWYHLLGVWVSGARLALFVNGVLEAQNLAPVTFSSAGNNVILGRGDNNNQALNGSLQNAAYLAGEVSDAALVGALYHRPYSLYEDAAEQSLVPFAGVPGADAGVISTLSWAGAFAAEPALADLLTWYSAFNVGGAGPAAAAADLAQTLTWSSLFRDDQNLNDTITWAGANEAFVLRDLFASEAHVVYWSGAFTAQTDSLASGRYRR